MLQIDLRYLDDLDVSYTATLSRVPCNYETLTGKDGENLLVIDVRHYLDPPDGEAVALITVR